MPSSLNTPLSDEGLQRFGAAQFPHPEVKGGPRNLELARPFDHHHGLPAPFKTDNIAPISDLNGLGGPSHISRLVVSFIINSIYTVFTRRGLANVLGKFGEIIPFWTNLNSLLAVVFPIPRTLFGETSGAHVLPRTVKLAASFVANRRTVFKFQGCYNFPVKAPATFAGSILELVSANGTGFSAIAFAEPIVSAFNRVLADITQNRKPAKFASNQRNPIKWELSINVHGDNDSMLYSFVNMEGALI